MRRLVTATTVLAFSSIAVLAADLPRKAATYVPVQRAFYDWTGFYIGANLGGGWASADSDFSVAGVTFASATNNMTGLLGGGQIGYNWQTGPAVFGVEADFQFTGQRGTLTAPPCPAATCGVALTASMTQKLPWFGTVRGRIGYAADSWLIYGTGGYAYGRVDTDASATAGPVGIGVSQSETRSGWTLGAGIEVGFSRNWTGRLEYLYIDFGGKDQALAFAGVPVVTMHSKVQENVVRGAVNYRF